MILGLVEGDVADKLASVVGDAGDGVLACEARDEQGALVGGDVAAEHNCAGTLDVDVGILDISREDEVQHAGAILALYEHLRGSMGTGSLLFTIKSGMVPHPRGRLRCAYRR